MSPEFTNKVHQYKKIPNSTQSKLIKIIPYVRITSKNKGTVLIQDGSYFDAGGKELDKTPKWIAAEVKKLSPVVREEVGLEPLEVEE